MEETYERRMERDGRNRQRGTVTEEGTERREWRERDRGGRDRGEETERRDVGGGT
jgi:hypothetical protein